ncbi:MAG TPA: DNA polymerase III subunit gamma/tau [Planctomycetaceae bacterium]|nr:DNA polymerase III subunit gamma/tau [Planctomycetaceae bacterium]
MNEPLTSTAASVPSPAPYQVVARRYRPRDFEHLVGQHHVAQALSNAISTGRIGHAYLFTGARGVGKTSSARIFAKSLDCVEGPTPHPCNECEICQSISTGEDVDVLEIDGASNRGIDEIRQLRQNASIRPSRAKYKIYIIDEVHMLTREAFNALLKTLEEPPEHVKFIFCTTEPTKIPITILSRCQRFDFAGIESGAIAGRLAEIASAENVTSEEGVFETLARRAAGSMRDAQSLLEQLLSFAPEHIRLADVHEMLGTANDQRLFRVLDGLLLCNPAVVFSELDSAAEEGVDFGTLIEQLMGIFRDLLVVAGGGSARLLLYCDPDRFDDLNRIGREFGIQRLLAALQMLDQTHNRMRYSTQGRILTELVLVRIAHLAQLQGIASLIEQLRNGVVPTPALPVLPDQRPSDPPLSEHAPASRTIKQTTKQTAKQTATQEVAPERMLPPRDVPAERQLERQTDPNNDTATENPKIDLASLDDAGATEIWRQAAEGLSGMLAVHAVQFEKIAFQQPDVFVATFSKPVSFESCEKGKATLQQAVQLYTGTPIRILCRLENAAAPVRVENAPKRPAAAEDRRNALQKAADEPIVARARELLDATLVDVKEN